MGYVGWVGTFEGEKGTGKERVFESELIREFRLLGAVPIAKVRSHIIHRPNNDYGMGSCPGRLTMEMRGWLVDYACTKHLGEVLVNLVVASKRRPRKPKG